MLNIYITVILLGLNLVFPKSKITPLLLFLFMWSLWGWNTWNGDYDLYEMNFDNSKDLSKEIGYSYLTYFFKSIGLSFHAFMIFSSLLFLSIICWLSIRHCSYPGLFSFIYFFVFLQGFVYLRNYYLWVIILFGLLKTLDSHHPKIVYGISVVLSLAFHSSAFLYLVFMPGISQKKVKAKRIILLAMILFFATFVLFNFISTFINNTSYGTSLEYYGSGIHFGASILFHFLFVLFFLYIDSKFGNKIAIGGKERSIMTLVHNFNVLSLLLLPVYLLVPYLPNRFIGFLVLVNLFYSMCIIKYSLKQKQLIMYSFAFLLSLCSISLAMLYVSTWPYTIIPLYMCNMIWGDDYTLHNLNVINNFN